MVRTSYSCLIFIFLEIRMDIKIKVSYFLLENWVITNILFLYTTFKNQKRIVFILCTHCYWSTCYYLPDCILLCLTTKFPIPSFFILPFNGTSCGKYLPYLFCFSSIYSRVPCLLDCKHLTIHPVSQACRLIYYSETNINLKCIRTKTFLMMQMWLLNILLW